MRNQGSNRNQSSRRSTTGTVVAKSGVLHGFYVNTVLGAGTVTLSTAVDGNIVVIPAATAAGAYATGLDIGWSGTLTATFASTGDITFIYDTAT